MTTIACLDVWAPAVRAAVRGAAPPGVELRFADSYEPSHQRAIAAGADAIVPGFAAIDEALLAAAPTLRVVHKWGIGLDAIDQGALRHRGIGLAITAGGNAGPVAELAVALILAVYRRIPYANASLREGRWVTPEMRETCWQISGKTVGLLGFGAIGRMLARRLAGFDAHIVYHDPVPAPPDVEARLQASRVSLDELLATSDIVSLHLPLLPQTRRIVDAQAIARMKDGAVLVNTARGGLVDEAALHAALVAGKLRGAGLDAFETEPPPADHPLLALPQVVATPHIGGGVFDNVAPTARHVFGNVMRMLHGEEIAAADRVLPANHPPVRAEPPTVRAEPPTPRAEPPTPRAEPPTPVRAEPPTPVRAELVEAPLDRPSPSTSSGRTVGGCSEGPSTLRQSSGQASSGRTVGGQQP